MLYKVTPMMAPPEKAAKKPRQPGEPRKKRKSAVYDHEGHEVLITLMCLKCRSIKPLAQFGLRKMADGAIRNQPWCRSCRSGAGVPKPKEARHQESAAAEAEVIEAADPAEAVEAAPAESDASADLLPETPVPGASALEAAEVHAEEPAEPAAPAEASAPVGGPGA
jgi:hypothetical protein